MTFLDLRTKPARNHAPPVNKAKNSHYSQRFKSGQVGYQIIDHFDISIRGSTMKIVDARAITVGAVDSSDARF